MEVEVHGSFGHDDPTRGPDGHGDFVVHARVGLRDGDDVAIDVEGDARLSADDHDLLRDDAVRHVEGHGHLLAGCSRVLQRQELVESGGGLAFGEAVDGFGRAGFADHISAAGDGTVEAEVLLALRHDGRVGGDFGG